MVGHRSLHCGSPVYLTQLLSTGANITQRWHRNLASCGHHVEETQFDSDQYCNTRNLHSRPNRKINIRKQHEKF